MGKGGGGMDYEMQGEEGWDGDGGALCLASSGGTRSCRGAGVLAIAVAVAATAMAMATARVCMCFWPPVLDGVL
jgi:hypothetical protein